MRTSFKVHVGPGLGLIHRHDILDQVDYVHVGIHVDLCLILNPIWVSDLLKINQTNQTTRIGGI